MAIERSACRDDSFKVDLYLSIDEGYLDDCIVIDGEIERFYDGTLKENPTRDWQFITSYAMGPGFTSIHAGHGSAPVSRTIIRINKHRNTVDFLHTDDTGITSVIDGVDIYDYAFNVMVDFLGGHSDEVALIDELLEMAAPATEEGIQ